MNTKRIAACMAAALMAVSAAGIPAHAAEQPANKTYESHETLSSIGSVSKTFTAVAVMQLADQGKLDIDAPVTEYLPTFRMADPRYRDITVRMLLDHTSGLMGTTAGDFLLLDDRDAVTHDRILPEAATQRLKADPGDFGAYCNDGFELAELIVENVSGESFTDYVEQHIAKPLGLQQTGTPWNAFRTAEQVPVFVNGNVAVTPDYCMAIGSGGILSTAPELCRFGSAFFRGNTTLLSEQAKQEMAKPVTEEPYEDGFGLGFDTVDTADYADAGVKIITKGGDIKFQHAGLVIAPDEEISIAVLSSGGSSMYNELMAYKLMDIALEEKGITVERQKPAQMETLDTVPEKYLGYADVYASGQSIALVSFPEGKYMEITTLTDKKPETVQYLYTTEDCFVQMDGLISSGKARQSKDQTLLRFQKRSGCDYIVSDSTYEVGSLGLYTSSSYAYQRVGQASVSDAAQAAWDARNGKKYYLWSAKYSNAYYGEQPCFTAMTYPEARGYVNDCRITDSDHAEAFLAMPGGRDLHDVAVRSENGTEYIDFTNEAMTFISEDAIPALPADLTEVALHTKQAVWYHIGDSDSQTITLDIPENAAVYVYDAFDRVTYSSHYLRYGNRVPLPAGGKIVFLGEDGGTIRITQ